MMRVNVFGVVWRDNSVFFPLRFLRWVRFVLSPYGSLLSMVTKDEGMHILFCVPVLFVMWSTPMEEDLGLWHTKISFRWDSLKNGKNVPQRGNSVRFLVRCKIPAYLGNFGNLCKHVLKAGLLSCLKTTL